MWDPFYSKQKGTFSEDEESSHTRRLGQASEKDPGHVREAPLSCGEAATRGLQPGALCAVRLPGRLLPGASRAGRGARPSVCAPDAGAAPRLFLPPAGPAALSGDLPSAGKSHVCILGCSTAAPGLARWRLFQEAFPDRRPAPD